MTRAGEDAPGNVTGPGLAPSPSPAPAADAAVYVEDCNTARAAGAPPTRDDAGYGPNLDRDGDGSACE